jgi:hypothetical protein
MVSCDAKFITIIWQTGFHYGSMTRTTVLQMCRHNSVPGKCEKLHEKFKYIIIFNANHSETLASIPGY